VKHRLKLTIPIIPALLKYEAVLERSTRMDLRVAWKRLKQMGRGSRWLFGYSVITALALAALYVLLSNVLQLDVPGGLILAGNLCGLAGGAFWVISRQAPRVTTRWMMVATSLSVAIGAILLGIGLWPGAEAAALAVRCRNARISPCLRLDLATGIDQEICPDDSEVLVLPPGGLDGLMNLSGRASLTPADLCTCNWEGQTKEGRPLEALHGPSKDCSFSFVLPDRPAVVYYLTLEVGGQHELFIVSDR
jgi:hypothetical protein